MFTTGTTTTTSAVNPRGYEYPPLRFDGVVNLMRDEAARFIGGSRITGAMTGSVLNLQIQTPYGNVFLLGAIDMSELQNTIIKNMVVKIEELAKQPGIDAATASIIQDAFIEMLRGSGAI